MNFDFSRYCYRNEFSEVASAEMAFETVLPVSPSEKTFKLTSDEGVLLDFGVEYVGRFFFQAKGEGKLCVDYGEWLDEIYRHNKESLPDWYETPKDSFSVASVSAKRFVSPGRRACRYIRLSVKDGAVEIENPSFETVNARIEKEGYFRCSDERLNRIYEIAKRTTKLCTQEYFEDGVKRDGICWIGDSRVISDCNYAVFGNTEVAERSILYLIRSMREDGWMPSNAIVGGAHKCPDPIGYMFDYVGGNIPEGTPSFYEGCGEIYYLTYCADFLGMIYEYYRYTENLAFLKKVFPYAKKVVDRICRIDRFDTKGKLMPRTGYKNRKYVDNLCDNGSYYCALVYNLKNYRKLCEVLKDEAEENVVEGYIAEFTEAALAYMDGEKRMWRQCGEEEKVYCPTAQSLAYLAGFCTKEEYAHALQAMDESVTAYPDTGLARYWFAYGAFEAGMTEYALAWIKKEWGFLLDRGATTCFERWDTENVSDWENDVSLSACHGWSSGPAALLIKYLLGVKGIDGQGRIVISPKLSGLEFVEGEVPTKYGTLYVKATKEGVRYVAPEGVEVVVQ